jgi:hypothetical protein
MIRFILELQGLQSFKTISVDILLEINNNALNSIPIRRLL